MADCGATGSALDRSAARFLSSQLGSESASRAGKAIASFFTGVAQTGAAHEHAASNPAPPLMPASIPTTAAAAAVQMVPRRATEAGQQYQHQQQQMWDSQNLQEIWTQPTASSTPYASQWKGQGMEATGRSSHSMVHAPLHAPLQMHSDISMQMMHQQIAMMQMAQQQQFYMQQQQQQQQQQHEQMFRNQEQTRHDIHEMTSNPIENLQQHKESSVQDSFNDWHQNIEDEFQSYLNQYRNDIVRDDAVSTHEYEEDELGHEGYVEGASIERLAAAWEEAEREFSTEDYANLGAGYNYEDEQVSHRHYEFSEESARYGLLSSSQEVQQTVSQEGGSKVEDKFMDLMSQGMKYFKEGNLSQAILCFESELRNVDGDNADAWLMLGKCHAENDEDRKAIVCLENAVERDPYSTEALLALGVSYVNELDHDRALKHLNDWVTHNPSYSGLARDVAKDDLNNHPQENALTKLKTLLNHAKAYDVTNGNMENSADVLETLGVLCNVSREYSEAVECFQSALKLRPDDHQLWNKLGATLANSGRNEEAHEAYQNALSIKPRYARSWLNMAIAHSNMQNHDEASRCYLQALSLNPRATHIWSYLRIALTCTERWDLLPFAASREIDAFREHFDFVA